jgi:hypothetical protein
MMCASLPFPTALSSFALTALLSVNVMASESGPTALTNPLLTESTLPYHLPPFAAIKDEHFAPAFEQGMLSIVAIRSWHSLVATACPLDRS